MRLTDRLLWLTIGGIVLPTLVLSYLGISAALQRQELSELRLRQMQRQQAELAAQQVAQWLAARPERILSEARQALLAEVSWDARFGQIEASDPLIEHLFVADAAGQVTYPRPPAALVAPRIDESPEHVLPTYVGLPHLAGSAEARVPVGSTPQERYTAALQSLAPLLRQSDPWLRAVALDLLARCYVGLQRWQEALAAYAELGSRYGGMVDAAGTPLAVGADYEMAYIYGQLGQSQAFLERYLTVYEGLVHRRSDLPEDQRRHLCALTRQALGDALGPGAPPALVARFQHLQAEDRRSESAAALLRWLWTHGPLGTGEPGAGPGGTSRLAATVDGRAVVLFWQPSGDGRLVGCEAAAEALAGELLAGAPLAAWPTAGLSLRTGPRNDTGSTGAARRESVGTGGSAPAARQPLVSASTAALEWTVQVPGMPSWVVAAQPLLPAGRSGPRLALGWLAGLAALGLVAGAVGLVRAARTRLRTSQLHADFVSAVSHELRTPLTSIRLFSEMLRDPGLEPARQRVYADHIWREGRRLERLVHNVLAFARASRGQALCDLRPVDFGSLVRSTVDSFGPLAEREGVALAAAIADGVPSVQADPDRLETVVFDLLDNAVRHGGSGGRVDVGLRPRNGSVVLEVADRGPGVPADERRRIFRPFYRGRAARQAGRAGTGLGLAVVERVIAAHGGEVSVAPREGGGCVFAVTLPATAAVVESGA